MSEKFQEWLEHKSFLKYFDLEETLRPATRFHGKTIKNVWAPRESFYIYILYTDGTYHYLSAEYEFGEYEFGDVTLLINESSEEEWDLDALIHFGFITKDQRKIWESEEAGYRRKMSKKRRRQAYTRLLKEFGDEST